jgi:hypothetical protein
MVGVPGRSKGCVTCRRRKKGVSGLSLSFTGGFDTRGERVVLRQYHGLGDASAFLLSHIFPFSVFSFLSMRAVICAGKELD